MTLNEAIDILKKHNDWKFGRDSSMQEPKKITEAIDIALNVVKGLKK